jgi:hypothetical protein
MKISYDLGKINVSFECDTVVRENDGNEYYELRCTDCGAKMAFGANKKGGGLFPRRKDTEGNWLPDNGWQRWNTKTKKLE